LQFPGQGKPPVGVIFDSNLGVSVDSALALSLLYGFDGKNDVRIVSLSVSRNNLRATAFCDAVGRFYAGVVSGPFGGFGRTLPIGLNDRGRPAEDTPMVTVPLARANGLRHSGLRQCYSWAQRHRRPRDPNP
jgi:hypothetical protein